MLPQVEATCYIAELFSTLITFMIVTVFLIEFYEA